MHHRFCRKKGDDVPASSCTVGWWIAANADNVDGCTRRSGRNRALLVGNPNLRRPPASSRPRAEGHVVEHSALDPAAGVCADAPATLRPGRSRPNATAARSSPIRRPARQAAPDGPTFRAVARRLVDELRSNVVTTAPFARRGTVACVVHRELAIPSTTRRAARGAHAVANRRDGTDGGGCRRVDVRPRRRPFATRSAGVATTEA